MLPGANCPAAEEDIGRRLRRQPPRGCGSSPQWFVSSPAKRRWRHNSALAVQGEGFRAVLIGFDWIRFARALSRNGRVTEMIGPDRKFSELSGNRHCVTHLYIADLLSKRTQKSRSLSLPARCAFVMTNAQRADSTALILAENHSKISSAQRFSPPRALRVRHAQYRAKFAAGDGRRV